MDSIFVSLGEAENYLTMLRTRRDTMIQKLRKRLYGGLMCEQLRFRIRAFGNKPNKKSFISLLRVGVCYCFGGKLAGLLFKKHEGENDRLLTHLVSGENKSLYHWAPSEQLGSILKNGLVRGEKLMYVYLTDAPHYIAHTAYIYQKVHVFARDIRFVLIKVDVNRLAEKHEIFWVDALHEFAVDSVPPDCLSVAEREEMRAKSKRHP